MATNTYVALQKTTVSGSSTSSVTLSSIPQGYTDLVLVFEGTESANQYIAFRVNSDTNSNYSWTRMYGDGSAAYSSQGNSVTFGRLGIGDPSSGRTVTTSHFMNYSNSTTYKSILSRSSGGGFVGSLINLWRSTAAITSITILTTTSDTFTAGSTFSLYGIAAEGATAKATGGQITSDSTYWYHTFVSSGTFTPLQSLTADYLVVAGGGGGGGRDANQGGGGGGAGAYRTGSATLSATGYTVTIGAGGNGNSNATGSTGSNSTFNSLTSSGGGGGGKNGSNGLSGGSGGGGGGVSGIAGSGSTGGNSGGNGGNSSGLDYRSGGGGGGASAAGGSAENTTNAGVGGAGTAWLNGTYYAGGGGGGDWASATGTSGTGGIGGGGKGGTGATAVTQANAVAGTANTGGGGGGRGYESNLTGAGAAGGSGIVIIRYLKA